MLKLTFLQTADMSKVNICPKRSITRSQYILISLLSYQGTSHKTAKEPNTDRVTPLDIFKGHQWTFWSVFVDTKTGYFLQEVSGFQWSVEKNETQTDV